MSVFDLFKQAPTTTHEPAATPAASASAPVAGDKGANPSPATTSAEPASPLDKFSKLWENDPNAPKDTPFQFNSDPTKLLETAKSVDFTKIIPPELKQRITAGGEDAQAAMMEAMNMTTQLAFAQSAHASSKMVESALQQQEQRFQDMLPRLIKQHSVADSFRSENPLMNDPALSPMIQALQSQFTKQYPNATAGEIKSHVNEFLDATADRIQAAKPKQASANAPQEMDWAKHFGIQ